MQITQSDRKSLSQLCCEYLIVWSSRGTHPRLGSASPLRLLDGELCRLVAAEAAKYVVSPPPASRGRVARANIDSRRAMRDALSPAGEESEARMRQPGMARRALRGDFESVAAAVAAVPPGSSLYLMPGVYHEPPMLVTARSSGRDGGCRDC